MEKPKEDKAKNEKREKKEEDLLTQRKISE